MALEKGTEEFIMFGEYFNLCKKYWDVSDMDEYWEGLICDLNKFIKKYKEIDLSRKMALAFSNTQETILKAKKRKE